MEDYARVNSTLVDDLDLKAKIGQPTISIADDGTAHGVLLGLVASKGISFSRMNSYLKATRFMNTFEYLFTAPITISLHDRNDITWDNKINTLLRLDEDGRL